MSHSPSSRKINILLVNPRHSSPGSIWDFSTFLSSVDKNCHLPPLSLIHIAAFLSNDLFELRLIDMNFTELDDSSLQWSDYVFLTAMNTGAQSLQTVIDRVGAAGKTAVVGGPYATLYYKSINNAACFLLGEAEIVLEQFISDLLEGKLQKVYATPHSKEYADELTSYFGDSIYLSECGVLPELADLPSPRYDLLSLDNYFLLSLQSTRGCPMFCEFCDIWKRFGRKLRHRKIEGVLSDLDSMYKLGWRKNILIAEDNIVGDKAYAKQLYTAVTQWQVEHGYPFSFLSESSLNLADDKELMEILFAAGVSSLFVGIETPCKESLKETNKMVNLKGSIEERVEILQRHGFELFSGCIIGFDADPQNIDDIIYTAFGQMGIARVLMSFLIAMPNTALEERMRNAGRLQPEHKGIDDGYLFASNIISPNDPVEQSKKMCNLLDKLYPSDMKNFFERAKIFISRRHSQRRLKTEILKDIAPGAQENIHSSGKAKPWYSGIPLILRLIAVLLGKPYALTALSYLWYTWRNYPKRLNNAFGDVLISIHHWGAARVMVQASELWRHMQVTLRTSYSLLNKARPDNSIVRISLEPENADTAVKSSEAVNFDELLKYKADALAAAEKLFDSMMPEAKSIISAEYQTYKLEFDKLAK